MQVLETKLRSPQLLEAKRIVLEREFDDLRQTLAKYKTMLTDYKLGLRVRRKPVVLVSCLVFGCFLLYSTYVLVYGP